MYCKSSVLKFETLIKVFWGSQDQHNHNFWLHLENSNFWIFVGILATPNYTRSIAARLHCCATATTHIILYTILIHCITLQTITYLYITYLTRCSTIERWRKEVATPHALILAQHFSAQLGSAFSLYIALLSYALLCSTLPGMVSIFTFFALTHHGFVVF